MAKQVKTVSYLDRISSFPDPILCHVLSFLPTKDAVRSSILSSRWRYLFASMPTFDFSDCLWYLSVRNLGNFYRFVDRLLFFPNQLSLECFRVTDPSWDGKEGDLLRIYGWICASLRRSVKEIGLYSENSLLLPTLLFTSHSLVTLKLGINGVIDVPSSVCLPNLKTLHLTDFQFPDGVSIHRLIYNCLALQELVMELRVSTSVSELIIHNLSLERLVLDFGYAAIHYARDFNNVIVINAPNLVYFKYIDQIAKGYTLSNMNSLEKADIRIYRLYEDLVYNVDREQSATRLFQGICNVQSLDLFLHEAETLFPTDLGPELEFHNLVELKLDNTCTDWQGAWLVEFLHRVPNLKTLILDWASPFEGLRQLPKEVPSCLSLHLREIKILRFQRNRHLFHLISYFLNHARILEKLVVGMDTLSEKEQLSVFKKLLKLTRSSKKCQVVTF